MAGVAAGVDAVPPTIVCPANQTLTLGANCSALLPDYTGMATAALSVPLLAAMLAAPATWAAYVLNAPLTFVTSAWIGAGIATVHDLVPPRLRGTAGAAYLLVITFVGLALGPYTVGKFSLLLGGLRPALLAGATIAAVLALLFLALAARTLPADQARASARLHG
jgi:MFS family permease